jgi:hypothetical protein
VGYLKKENKMFQGNGKINLEEAARKTMVLDVNSRYPGLETLVLMENAGQGVVEEISRRQVFFESGLRG